MRTERYTVAQVLDAIHEMHTCWGAAQRLKCSPCTVRGYAKRHPTVADALDQETRDLVDLAKLVIREKLAKKDLGAAIFVLKTRAKDEGWTERQEITGADGQPFRMVVVEEIVTACNADTTEPT